MKKTLSFLLILTLFFLAACSTSPKQLTPDEIAAQDSIAKVSLDSLKFITYLQSFIKSIEENKNQDNYIHKTIGVYVYTNPGTFCIATKNDKMGKMDSIKNITINNIFNQKPKGDFCEGYPGEKDGFYFYEITEDGLQSYYDVASNDTKKVTLPADLNYTKFIKVNIIKGEYFLIDLYFTRIDSTWYLIGQSFCDCSA